MQEQNRFFLWVNRLLALGALLGLMVVIVFALWGFGSSFMLPHQPNLVVPVADPGTASTPTNLRVGRVVRLTGTASRMIELRAGGEPGGGSSLRFKEPDYGTLRNLLFLSGDPVQPRWLFDDADQMLARAEPICAEGTADYSDACPQAEKRTLAVYLEVIAKDSNRNGMLDHEDRAVPALVRTDGTGYTPLGTAVDNVVDVSVSSDGTRLNLLVEEAGALHDRSYALADFRRLSSRKVADLAR